MNETSSDAALPEWEADLLRRATGPAGQEQAEQEQAPEWEALHSAPPGGTVDLTGVWEPLRIPSTGHLPRGYALVERLATRIGPGRGWIVARRLAQAAAALANSPDGAVHVSLTTPLEGLLDVTAWCWGDDEGRLPWRIHAELEITVSVRGRMRTRPTGRVTLTTQDWTSGAVTYLDGPDGPLGQILAQWLTGWTGRLALQGYAGVVEDPGVALPDLVSREDFAARLR